MRIAVVVCLVVCTLSASDVIAQTATGGSIRGYIKDEQDAVLPRVRLTATSPDAPGTYTGTSDDGGYYRLLDLPPGTYTIRAELEGFSTWVRDGVAVRAGLNLSVPVVMKVGAQTETVEVKAETPLIESRSAVQAVNVSGDLQRALPLSGRRNWADSLLLAPGVVSQETTNNTQFFFVHGSDLGSNTFLIDGADAAASSQSTPLFIGFSAEAIEDVHIKTGAVDASTPLGLGAGMNLTTKSGTNSLKGAASLAVRSKVWNDNNVVGGTASATSFVQPDMAAGGPIARDRWWFFGSYRRVAATTGLSRTAAQVATVRALVPDFIPFDLVNRGNIYFAKTSIAAGASHRLQGSYQRDPNASQSAGADSAGANDLVRGGDLISMRWQSVWTSSLTTQLSLSSNDKGSVNNAKRTGEPFRSVFQSTALSSGRVVGIGRLAIYGATGMSNSSAEGEKLTVAADVTLFKRRWRGAHQLQTGVFLQPRLAQRIALDYVNGGAAIEDRVPLDSRDLSKGTRVFHTQTYETVHQVFGDQAGSDYGLYLQDSWNPITAMTVNAGIRIDFINRTDDVFNVRTQRSREIGPRIGINYAVTGDGRTVTRVSWSRVHETPSQNWISLGSSAAGITDRYDLNGDGVLETTLVTPGSTTLNPSTFIDLNRFHQPRADEWNVGVRRQVNGGVALDVGFTNRMLADGIAYLETNGIYQNGRFLGYRNESLNSVFQVTNNRWNWQVLREIDLTVTKQTERVQLIATYARQWRHLGGTWQPNDPASFIQSAAFADDKGIGLLNDTSGGPQQNGLSGTALAENAGPAAQWRDHVARVGISYTARWNVTLAANTTIQSGAWSGPVVRRIEAANPVFGPATVTLSNGRIVANPLATAFRFVGETRGDGQFALPTYYTVNLRVGKTTQITRIKFNTAIEGFNVTNRASAMGLLAGGNQVGNANFMKGTLIQLPRSMQLSVRASF